MYPACFGSWEGEGDDVAGDDFEAAEGVVLEFEAAD